MKFGLWVFGLLFLLPTTVNAIKSPLQVPNNKFGIHIINPIESEIEDAASLVNSNGGDWGYVTFVVQRNDLNQDKWQTFFNLLKKYHLIPILRIATEVRVNYWVRPDGGDAKTWADFLDSLVWPTKNRYVVIYNEPNHGKEWGGEASPLDYAQILDETITALKIRSQDFFVLNAGFDESAFHKPPSFYDEEKFLIKMEKEVPGIFSKLDGWSSHSYPNPGFSGNPKDVGRGTVRGWEWEMEILKKLGVPRDLPVFITETGWQHAEGQKHWEGLPTVEKVAEYFNEAFTHVWADPRIVAITPFVLDYTPPPFDHFSFRKVLGASTEFYPHYALLASLPKNAGEPLLEKLDTSQIENKYPIPWALEVAQKLTKILFSLLVS